MKVAEFVKFIGLWQTKWTFVKIRFNTAENEPSEVWSQGLTFSLYLAWSPFFRPQVLAQERAHARRPERRRAPRRRQGDAAGRRPQARGRGAGVKAGRDRGTSAVQIRSELIK